MNANEVTERKTELSNKNMRFIDSEISPGKAKTTAVYGDSAYEMFFEFNQPIDIELDDFALALSTLCGKEFEEIRFDLPLSPETSSSILQFTGASVEAPVSPKHRDHSARSGVILSFSGGFDSLAAKILMPAETVLVSTDFGGGFSRERRFFEKFDPLILKTNFRSTPLTHNSWAVMGIGAILSSSHAGARFHSFGSILESSPWNFRPQPIAAYRRQIEPFIGAGLEEAGFVNGLTEVSTLRVILMNSPELAVDSLKSLAHPNEPKFKRKILLLDVLAREQGIDLGLDVEELSVSPSHTFGESFAVDLLAIWFLSRGESRFAEMIAANIPEEVRAVSARLSLSFMDRYHPDFYATFPQEILAKLLAKFVQFGIGPYVESDWKELNALRELFADRYHFLREP